MGVTSQLAEYCAGIKLAALPREVVTRARFLVLDLVGNIVRARHDAESTASFVSAVRTMGMATGNSGVFGDAARYSPAGAAFLNGALAHSLDFDDTHAPGSLHPGAPVIPAALAAGDMVGASGADVLAAIEVSKARPKRSRASMVSCALMRQTRSRSARCRIWAKCSN
jgi:2-methylcitrate dehydratase PrpD